MDDSECFPRGGIRNIPCYKSNSKKQTSNIRKRSASLKGSQYKKKQRYTYEQKNNQVELLAKKDKYVLNYNDIKSGSLVEAKLLKITDAGLEVEIGNWKDEEFVCSALRGFIPSSHVSHKQDSIIKAGDVLKCRVLNVSVEFEMVGLTNLPALVESNLPVITSYSQLRLDDLVLVYIQKKLENGLAVGLYNNVKGLIPNCQYTRNKAEDYSVGKVLCVRVLSVNPKTEEITFSVYGDHLVKHIGDNVSSFISANRIIPNYRCGQLASVEVVEKLEKGFLVRLIDDSKSSHFTLPIHHLSDFQSVAEAKYHFLEKGSLLKVAFSRSSGVTLKENFIHYIQNNSTSEGNLKDLEKDDVLPGFVSDFQESGEVVMLPGGLQGFSNGKYIDDAFWENGSRYHAYGQSVMVKINQICDNGKLFVSLRQSETGAEDTSNQVEKYFNAREMVKRKYVSKKLKVDINCLVNVKDSETYGIFDVEGAKEAGYHGIFTKGEVGESGQAVIVSVDYVKKEITLTQKEPVLSFSRNRWSDKIPCNSIYNCSVLHLDDDIAVAYMTSKYQHGRIVILSRYRHWNQFPSEILDDISIGSEIQFVAVQVLYSGILLGRRSGPNDNHRKFNKRDFLYPLTKFSFQDLSLTDIEIKERMNGLDIGQKIEACVKSLHPDCAVCVVSEIKKKDRSTMKGVIHASNLLTQPLHDTVAMESVRVGQTLTCYVMGLRRTMINGKKLDKNDDDDDDVILEMGLLEDFQPLPDVSKESLKQLYPKNAIVTVYVTSYLESSGTFGVTAKSGIHGVIRNFLVTNQPGEKFNPDVYIGKAIECRVIEPAPCLSFRAAGTIICGRTGEELDHLRSGSISTCRVQRIGDFDVFVETIAGLGRVRCSDLLDVMVDRPNRHFKVNQILRCYVFTFDPNEQKSLISLRPSHTAVSASREQEAIDLMKIESLKEGLLVDGYVIGCKKVGVFIELHRNFCARALLKHTIKPYRSIEELQQILYLGRLVKCRVLSKRKDHVNVSLLQQDTSVDLDELPEQLPLSKMELKSSVHRKLRIMTRNELVKLIMETPVKDTAEIKIVPDVSIDVTKDPGFVWFEEEPVAQLSDDEECDADDMEKVSAKNKKTKEEEEESLRRREEELMDDLRTPQTVGDWERILVSDPDNSMLWIRYMAFHIHSTEVDKARSVAEKALKTINFRKENEKLNIWVTLLNLENLYGDNETMEETIRRALASNDQLKLYRHLVKIYTQSGKLDKAREVYEKLVKKFRGDKEVWLAYMQHLLIEHGREVNLQEILQRCLQGVPIGQHLEVISKVAQLEFKHGDVERGKTIFENLITTHPKRTDLWSLYIDMLVETNRTAEAREVFNRVTSLKLSSKKISSFFKRFIDFEKIHGNNSTLSEAKNKALEYLNATAR